jgi:hypothetical protein
MSYQPSSSTKRNKRTVSMAGLAAADPPASSTTTSENASESEEKSSSSSTSASGTGGAISMASLRRTHPSLFRGVTTPSTPAGPQIRIESLEQISARAQNSQYSRASGFVMAKILAFCATRSNVPNVTMHPRSMKTYLYEGCNRPKEKVAVAANGSVSSTTTESNGGPGPIETCAKAIKAMTYAEATAECARRGSRTSSTESAGNEAMVRGTFGPNDLVALCAANHIEDGFKLFYACNVKVRDLTSKSTTDWTCAIFNDLCCTLFQKSPMEMAAFYECETGLTLEEEEEMKEQHPVEFMNLVGQGIQRAEDVVR